jgi:transcriptional regulator with XRE-family HTH domain
MQTRSRPQTAGPTVRRRRLGLILRGLRERHGLTCDQAAQRANRSGAWVSRVEAGRVAIRSRDLTDLLDLYRVTEQAIREELGALAKAGAECGWLARNAGTLADPHAAYLGFEAEADNLRVFETLAVHGLLQTEQYARATVQAALPALSPEAVERKVRIRLARQELMDRADPLRLWAIFDESVLHRRIGGTEVLRDQLHRLLLATEVPTVTIQVMPFEAGANPGMLGPFAVIRFPAREDPDVVYVEGLIADVFAEGEDARCYAVLFEHLQATALSPARSYERIEQAVRELT